METFENLLMSGRRACHHLAVGQTRVCGVCGIEATVAGIDMPEGYQGKYRPACCRPICISCLPHCASVVRASAPEIHSTITDFQAIIDLAQQRQMRAKKV